MAPTPDLAAWHWTPADVAALRQLVRADMPDKAIARRLGRTLRAVQRRRALLGLRKQGYVRRRIVRLLKAGYTVAATAVMVNRSESHCRMVRLAHSRRTQGCSC
jgi:predicted transcriptional regulator